jgi:hypothetical protein
MTFVFLIHAQETIITDTLSDSASLAQDKPDTTVSLSDTLPTSLPVDTSAQAIGTDTSVSEEDVDTSFCNWKYPFWSFGAGWELGSFKLFELWEEGLETNRLKATMHQQLSIDTIISVLTVSPIEIPAVYNVTFPLSISYTPFVFKRSFLSLGCSYSWIRKYSHVSFKLDSLIPVTLNDSIIDLEQRLSLKTLTFSLKYKFLIPDIYFNIEKIRESYLTLGISGSPLVILREWYQYSLQPEEKKNSYGISAGWLAGIATFRRISSKMSLEMGFVYSGSWQGRFMDNNHHRMIGDITKSETNPSEVLQFVSHRFILYFNLLIGKKEYRQRYLSQTE